MPILTVPGTDLTYHLISFDKNGTERADDPDGVLTDRARQAVRAATVTDVFITSHGWKGDLGAAKEQYDAWIGAMAECGSDRQRMRTKHPDFAPLIIGFHWPSQPWGEEEFGTPGASFAAPGTQTGPTSLQEAITVLVDRYADRIADTPRARSALQTILDGAAKGAAPMTMPPEISAAYAALAEEAGLTSEGASGAPGEDAERFDAAHSFQNARAAGPALAPPGSPVGPPSPLAFGGPSLSGLLSPLRQLSFWKMKDRARKVGESAGFTLLRSLQDAVPAGRTVRFHLMGHSFGCIVVSSMANGPDGQGALKQPVDSLTLVQGALSLWAYCNDLPGKHTPGYFHGLVKQGKVRGPILTTRSKRDTAVGKFYPIAAGIALQIAFGPGELPKYGGLGAWGIQGPGLTLHDLVMQGTTGSYGFSPGHVHNLECSQVIKDGTGPSGAHSDIAKAEVAHAMWDAVIGA